MRLTSHDITRKPVITGESMAAMAKSKYTFMVHMAANKVRIKRAVEEVFNVKVANVKTTRFEGKTKRVRVHIGKRANFRETVTALAEGSSIKFFEGIQ